MKEITVVRFKAELYRGGVMTPGSRKYVDSLSRHSDQHLHVDSWVITHMTGCEFWVPLHCCQGHLRVVWSLRVSEWILILQVLDKLPPPPPTEEGA